MLRRYRPGEMPTAADFNRLIDEVNNVRYRTTSSPGIEVMVGGGGPHIRQIPPPEFWAQIIEQDPVTGACSWIEVCSYEDGTFFPPNDARQGYITANPAYEVNRTLFSPQQLPFYTWLRLGFREGGAGDQEWLFDHCCSGTPGSSSFSSSSSSSGTPASQCIRILDDVHVECVNGQIITTKYYKYYFPATGVVSDTPCDNPL